MLTHAFAAEVDVLAVCREGRDGRPPTMKMISAPREETGGPPARGDLSVCFADLLAPASLSAGGPCFASPFAALLAFATVASRASCVATPGR